MIDHPRSRTIAERIQVIVAETLERRVKDPRLGFVTVTDVKVTGDLQHATIFYTVFGSDEDREGTAAALESAKGVVRREVGRGIGIRLTPSLEFIADALPEGAAHMADLLAQTAARDAELAARAAVGRFAGDADPYKKPVVDEGDEDDDPELDDEPAEADRT
ncbi:MAG: 30S ribosome-binding factor RbfA [Actinomycetota bacterium]